MAMRQGVSVPRISPSLEKYKIMARKIKSGIADLSSSPIRELPSASSINPQGAKNKVAETLN